METTTTTKLQPAWQVAAEGRVPGVIFITAKKTYVFPWGHLLLADGDSGKIILRFTTHDVKISGTRLDELLKDVALQRVTVVKRQTRATRFHATAEEREEAQISDIEVREAGTDVADDGASEDDPV